MSRCTSRARSCRSSSAPGRARRFLGAHARTSSRTSAKPTRRRSRSASPRSRCSLWQALAAEPAGVARRRHRRHRRRPVARARGARREAARRGAAGTAAPRAAGRERTDVNELLPLAMACFLLGAVETAAIGRMFAAQARLPARQPTRSSSRSPGANLAAGLGHGFPVSGGMSQSLVNESGGRAPRSRDSSPPDLLVVALFLSGLLRDLPQPVLAAIVLVAVTGLFKVADAAAAVALQPRRVRGRHRGAARRARLRAAARRADRGGASRS